MRSKKLRNLFAGVAVVVALLAAASSGLSNSSQAGARSGTVARMGAPTRAHFKMTKKPPNLTRAQLARLERELRNSPKPAAHPLPVGTTAAKRADSAAGPSTATRGPRSGSAADGSFSIFRNFYMGDTIKSNTSGLTGEPNVVNAGDVVFATGNWWAAISGDNGRTFRYISPYTTFPSAFGGFCCDQKAVYDPSHNIIIWYLQYSSSGPAGAGQNIFRVAVAHPDQALNGSWWYWDFTSASNTEYDYPDMCLSNDFVYMTTNRGTYNSNSVNDAFVFRMPLTPLSQGAGFGYTFWDVGSFGLSNLSLKCTHGAHEVMYFGSHNSTSQIRLFSQPESNTTLYWNGGTNLSATWNNGTHICPTPDSRPWCGFDDGRMLTGWIQDTRQGHLVGFMWNAAGAGGASNCNGTALSCPYIDAARVTVSDSGIPPSYTYRDRPFLWIGGGTAAAQYPAIGANARGDLGLTWYYSDSNFDPYFAVGIDDDFHRCCGWDVSYIRNSSQGPNTNRWGDYFNVSPFGQHRLAWQTVGTTMQGCGGVGCKESNYVVFGRERDTASVAGVRVLPRADLTTTAALAGAQRGTFNVDVSNVNSGDFVLRRSGTVSNIPASRSCRNASNSSVSCFSGSVRSATLTPSAPLFPGASYNLVVNPPGAASLVTDGLGNTVATTAATFRASTEEQESSVASDYLWGSIANANAYGGSFTRDDMNGGSALFTFTGTGVTWYTVTGPGQGKADVYIDNVFKGTVDNSAATTHYKVARSYSGLSASQHTIRIVAKGQAGANGTRTTVTVDAFQVGATLYSTPTVAYRWQQQPNASAWGGAVARDDLSGNFVNFHFSGTGVTWYSATGPSMGMADVYVDGALVRTVDVYSPSTRYHVGFGVNGLSAGPHTLKVAIKSAKNPSSAGHLVLVDGWVVQP